MESAASTANATVSSRAATRVGHAPPTPTDLSERGEAFIAEDERGLEEGAEIIAQRRKRPARPRTGHSPSQEKDERAVRANSPCRGAPLSAAGTCERAGSGSGFCRAFLPRLPWCLGSTPFRTLAPLSSQRACQRSTGKSRVGERGNGPHLSTQSHISIHQSDLICPQITVP